MNPQEAEKIINQYGALIANAPKGKIALNVFSLPYSPGKIRYAFFVYVEALINEGLFDDTIKGNLELTYAMLDTKFRENDDEINEAWPKYKSDQSARDVINKCGGLSSLVSCPEKMNEFHNFVADCYGNWGKKST